MPLAILPTFGYGEVGADGGNVEVKNSYADFNVGPVNLTVGVQPYSLFRDFHISTDASGLIGRWKVLDNFVLAGSWLKAFEGGEGTWQQRRRRCLHPYGCLLVQRKHVHQTQHLLYPQF